MLHSETINPLTKLTLQKLQSVEELSQTRLVGGTALALQLGHRISVDLDLFGEFDNTLPLDIFFQNFESVKKTGGNRYMSFYEINGIKVDIVKYNYPWLRPAIEEESVKLAAIEDIAAMKINAIVNRGTKKDFVDLNTLLEQYSFMEILGFYQQKYSTSDIQIALRSCCYFEDAESEIMPHIIKEISWEAVKKRILSEVSKIQ